MVLATVAQSVEQLIRNQQAAGSSPASSSIKKTVATAIVFFILSASMVFVFRANWNDSSSLVAFSPHKKIRLPFGNLIFYGAGE